MRAKISARDARRRDLDVMREINMTKSPTILTRRNIFRAGAGLAVAATATPLLTPASAKAENARQADAEPNPEAQKTDASATKNAAAPSRPGAILVSQFGPVKIHSYLSPADGLQVNMRSSSSMVSSCCRMPTKLRHTCRRSASPSIGSFSRMRIPITGPVFRF
jgi:hypothetical protein